MTVKKLIPKGQSVDDLIADLKEKKQNLNAVFEKLTPHQKELIAKQALINNLINGQSERQKRSLVDVPRERLTWLESKSPKSQSNYKYALEIFDRFVKKPNLLETTRSDVLNYQIWLKKQRYSANSQRLLLDAASSFFQHFVNFNYLSHNPFHGINRPRKQYKHPNGSTLMSTSTLNQVVHALSPAGNSTHRQLWKAVKLVLATGLRWSEIGTAESNREYFRFIAKGSKHRTLRTPHELIPLFELTGNFKKLFPKWNSNWMRTQLNQILKPYQFRNQPTPHDFRHYFAKQLYEKTRSVVAVKTALGHSNIAITDTYLNSLGYY